MLRKVLSRALAAVALTLVPTTYADELCALAPSSYATAKLTYPKAAAALAQIEKYSIATWYADRNGDYAATLRRLVSTCSESTRLSIVVYGIPNKDCEAGYSSSGSTVKTAADYLKFLTGLGAAVGNRKALYVLEPDAVGLLAKDGGCGEAAGYRENLKTAIKTLSSNPNADIYLDVGYWTLQYASSLSRVAAVVKELASAGAIKGITINSSNYRANSELSALCSAFQTAMGSSKYRCVVDTSRNYNEPTSNEWCNVKTAGIGHPPTSNTTFGNLDYFMWVKPPGESDGECNGGSHAAESLRGPAAGLFFEQAFALLWDQGYFVKELGMPTIDGSGPIRTPAPTTTAPVTPTPTSASPIQQHETPAPTTEMPASTAPDIPTPAPTTESPASTAPAIRTPAPTTQAPVTTAPAIQRPAPITEAPVTGKQDFMKPVPTSEASGSVDPPLSVTSFVPSATSTMPMTTPTPTPCVSRMAGNVDVNQQAAPSPAQSVPTITATSTTTATPDNSARMTPHPTHPLPITSLSTSTPVSSESRSSSHSTDVDADSSAAKHPTPAPTSMHRSDVDQVAIEHEGTISDSVKQATIKASGGNAGTAAGIFAVFVAIGIVVAIAAYMNAHAKKKQMEEPKQSPAQPATNRACEVSYLSAL